MDQLQLVLALREQFAREVELVESAGHLHVGERHRAGEHQACGVRVRLGSFRLAERRRMRGGVAPPEVEVVGEVEQRLVLPDPAVGKRLRINAVPGDPLARGARFGAGLRRKRGAGGFSEGDGAVHARAREAHGGTGRKCFRNQLIQLRVGE